MTIGILIYKTFNVIFKDPYIDQWRTGIVLYSIVKYHLTSLTCLMATDWMETGNFSIVVIPVLLRENIFIAVNDSLCEGLRVHKMVMG